MWRVESVVDVWRRLSSIDGWWVRVEGGMFASTVSGCMYVGGCGYRWMVDASLSGVLFRYF